MKHDQKIMRSRLSRVRGLGSAKDGTHHWWMQRLSAIALIPLSIWFAGSVLVLTGMHPISILQWMQQPFNAIFITLFAITGLYHGTIGMQVVIEDYVHNEASKFTLLIAMKLLMGISIAMVLFAMLKMSLGGF